MWHSVIYQSLMTIGRYLHSQSYPAVFSRAPSPRSSLWRRSCRATFNSIYKLLHVVSGKSNAPCTNYMLNERQFQDIMGSDMRSPGRIKNELPRGSVLESHFFCLYSVQPSFEKSIIWTFWIGNIIHKLRGTITTWELSTLLSDMLLMKGFQIPNH